MTQILTAEELKHLQSRDDVLDGAMAVRDRRKLLEALELVQKQLANRIRIDDVRASVNVENPPAKCDCETCQSDRQALYDTGWRVKDET